MSKVTVLDWVAQLSAGLADATLASRFYDEAIINLAHDPDGIWFGNFILGSLALDEEIKEVPEDLVRLHAVFFRDQMLSWETKQAMEALDPTWRTRRHTPVAYITDDIEDRYIRIWPPSDVSCDELGWLYTQTLTDAPAVMELPLAFMVLGREFSRESAHRDMQFAELCFKAATGMLAMVAAP
jgi:hypothetical protein